MRKTSAVIAALGLIAAFYAGPALAGKKKHIHDSFTATLAPFPKLATVGDPLGMTKPGCFSGQQDVHWMRTDFKAPAAGTVTATMEGFTGDWDLALLDEEGNVLLASVNDQIQGGAAAEEEVVWKVKAGQSVGIAPCNWLGAPEATVDWMYVSK